MLLLRRTSCLLVTMCGMAQVQAQGARAAIDAPRVAAVFAAHGVAVASSAISLPAGLSSTAGAELQIAAAQRVGLRAIQVRLACVTAASCLPFLATVQTQSPAEALGAVAMLGGAQTAVAAPHAAAPLTEVVSRPEKLLAGSHATLRMEDAHMRILLPVVAIDSGAPGADVRVSTLDRKQVFHAVVMDVRTVEGVLP